MWRVPTDECRLAMANPGWWGLNKLPCCEGRREVVSPEKSWFEATSMAAETRRTSLASVETWCWSLMVCLLIVVIGRRVDRRRYELWVTDCGGRCDIYTFRGHLAIGRLRLRMFAPPPIRIGVLCYICNKLPRYIKLNAD